MPEENQPFKQELPAIYDIEILGQKFNFPNSPYKLAAFILMIGAIIFLICYVMANRYAIVNNSEGFSFTVVDKKAVITDGYTIGFWTPSDSTKLGLEGVEDSAAYDWQIHCAQGTSFEEANQKFGSLLKTEFQFPGYRRYKVYGEGGGHPKEGWWWSIKFQGKCNEEFLKDLKDVYTNFWVPEKDRGKGWDRLYVEIIGSTNKVGK